MPVLSRALEIQGEITDIRRDIHAHPELACQETQGLGKTGLVGTLRKGNSLKAIGLRAEASLAGADQRSLAALGMTPDAR